MRMEQLLFADENAPEWAFSKRKGVKKWSKIKSDFAPLNLLKGIKQKPNITLPLPEGTAARSNWGEGGLRGPLGTPVII